MESTRPRRFTAATALARLRQLDDEESGDENASSPSSDEDAETSVQYQEHEEPSFEEETPTVRGDGDTAIFRMP